MKKFLKAILPNIVLVIYSKYRDRMVNNFFSKHYKKRVLVSYITHPFRKQSLAHSSYFEVMAAAQVFDELGYVVDIIHYQGKIPDLNPYDVIYGFGDVFQKYFEGSYGSKKTIYYGAGMHVCHQNTVSLQRVKSVFYKKGIWLAKSARFVEKTWTHQTTLVDGIIALGDDYCAETYRRYYDGIVYSLPAPFFRTVDSNIIMSERHVKANKSYLWFGSSGLIHKGLDLCLEFFSSREDLSLHICGNFEGEEDFFHAYSNEIDNSSNINVHGFVAVDSDKFKEILKQCSYVIFPSCSEGGAVSVLTAAGNGGLIPIVSKESSVSSSIGIIIDELSIRGLSDAINFSQELTNGEVLDMQKVIAEYMLSEHHQDVYISKLKHQVQEILK